MPNWCLNLLIVDGDPAAIKEIYNKLAVKTYIDWGDTAKYIAAAVENATTILGKMKALKELHTYERGMREYFLFTPLCPPPAEVVAKGYDEAGHEWCWENWGTKWDTTYRITKYPDGAIFQFETAWAPPIPFVAEMQRRYPTLTWELFYYEPSMKFAGIFVPRTKEHLDKIYHDDGPLSDALTDTYPDIKTCRTTMYALLT